MAERRECKEANCGKAINARGWCGKHYMDWYSESVLTTPCAVESCDKRAISSGLCSGHYARLKRTGTTEPSGYYADEETRFWRKVDQSGECWTWAAAKSNNGYGIFSRTGRVLVYAHRFSYEIHNGEPPPPHLEVMHACDNPPCVNPAHLALGTHADNMADMSRKGRRGKAGAA